MKIISLLGTAAALAIAGPAMAANLVTNGDFETSNLSGWTFTNTGGGSVPVTIQYGQNGPYPSGAYGEAVPSGPNGGAYGLYFSSDTARPHAMSQLVNLVAGQTYSLSFDFYVPQNGYNNANDATLGFTIGDAQAGDIFRTGSADGVPPRTWRTFSTSWTALADGDVALSLNFNGLGLREGDLAADFVVDNIAMTAVPEPTTWALMIGGFGLAGMQLRRRKTSVSFA